MSRSQRWVWRLLQLFRYKRKLRTCGKCANVRGTKKKNYSAIKTANQVDIETRDYFSCWKVRELQNPKSRGLFYFSCNSHLIVSLLGTLPRGGVTQAISSAACLARALRCKLQEKLPRVTAPQETPSIRFKPAKCRDVALRKSCCLSFASCFAP